MAFIHYASLLIFTYGIFAILIYSLLTKFIKSEDLSASGFVDRGFLLIISIGVSLPIISLILYYLFLIIPKQSSLAYLGFIFLITTVGFTVSRKQFLKEIKISSEFLNLNNRIFSIFSLLTLVFIGAHTLYIFNRSISEHDYLEYGTLGKIFFRDRMIGFSSERFDEQTNFYYVGLHGFLFSLSLTWEKIWGSMYNFDSDLFYKGISGTYALLSLALFYKINRKTLGYKWASFATIALAFSTGFFIVALRFHIDSLRIFFFIATTYLLFIILKKRNSNYIILYSILLGIQAFAHSLGVFIGVIGLISFFIFCNSPIKRRIFDLALVVAIMLLFGGAHYVIDTLWGTGWIFKGIKFY